MKDALQIILGLALVIGGLFVVAIINGPPINSVEGLQREYPAWTLEECQAVAANRLWIGMTEGQALESQGRPAKVNKTVTAGGVHEQWIYRGEYRATMYLYFDAGRLTSWQE